MMRSNEHLALPSLNSAFTRPRQRRRPDIEPSPSLCRKLDFGSAFTSGNDVTRTVHDVTREEQELFSARWKDSASGNKLRIFAIDIKKENIPTSDWIPIIISPEEKSSVLGSYETVRFNPRQRPLSPIPFQKQSSLSSCTPPAFDSSSHLKLEAAIPRVSSADIFSRNSSSSSNCDVTVLPRSFSDPLSGSTFRRSQDKDAQNRRGNRIARGWLTPPSSPLQERMCKSQPTTSKTRQLKLTGMRCG